jgi:cation:H+ antiporter
MTLLLIQFLAGVLLLSKAADWFARAIAMVAELARLPRVLLGAVLIGFITNLPEFLISSLAAWRGHTGIALGNPIGSNIANTGLILGLILIRSGRSAFDPTWLRSDGIPMIFSCLALYVLVLWLDVTRGVAALLLLLCAAYVAWAFVCARRQDIPNPLSEVPGDSAERSDRWMVVAVLLVISIPLVFVTSRWVVTGAVGLAEYFGIGETVIALSLVAVGTSLPELATALAASKRGHQDTSIGIILGSNIFNALGVIGLSGMIATLPVTLANRLFDLPVMLLVITIAFLPMLVGKAPGKAIGYTLVATYGFYTYSLFTLYGIFS